MKEIINVIITPKIVKATLIPLRLFVTLAKVFPIEVYEYVYMNIELNWGYYRLVKEVSL